MHHTQIVFVLTVLFSLGDISSQNVDVLIQKADSGDVSAQYQIGMVFYNTSLSLEPNSNSKSLKMYYQKQHALDPVRELDSLDNQFYKEWVEDSYEYYITKSAKQGHDKAQLQLGKYYENLEEFGSKLRAYKWYASSAKKKNTEAIKWINAKNNEKYLKQYINEEDYKRIDFYVDVLDLSNRLCSLVDNDAFNNTLDTSIENELLQFLKLTKKDSTYRTKLIDFWNVYNKFFICVDNDTVTVEHIMKKSLKTLFYKHNQILFDWLMDLSATKKIDFNQVIYFDGHPETILDFLDAILQNKNMYQQFEISAIRELKSKLIKDFGAKNFYQIKH
ncbi:hypothetical protein [Psychroserpens sp. SPM9]|uniref:hypothetical protein n=1 Tax=Psychroserpens sp. SPM9 TaxID=2975598 RepID=UPI0021A90737|nr:hypothetical protein [Psychroserpens sp. SPM9]MDG5490969.1 hypothetical protein [Psychroserpens sp. SPM9]